ncbi:MAG: hypothetical protein U1E59_09975 [Amaricoccus sp.]
MARIAADGISVGVTNFCGMLEGLEIERGGRRIRPLHRAPWVGHSEELPEDPVPHHVVLEGDFFCAPFGQTDEPGVAAHGWPANGTWRDLGTATAADGAVTMRLELEEKVSGATVTKEVTLRPGHPVVYQRHLLTGGSGAVPIAHHAMIHVPGGARLSFSTKDFGATPEMPQETDPARGVSILAATAADGAVTMRLELEEKVSGATVTKEVTLRPGHPVVYQRHLLTGGSAPCRLRTTRCDPCSRRRTSASAKDFGATPEIPQETDPARGVSILASPQRFGSLAEVALADGSKRDMRSYPWADGHEDFLSLIDPKDAVTGWSAAVAAADGFVFFAVKDARMLCQTSLWMSNGGRFFAPWSSRHKAVLGIEEGTTFFGNGRLASAAENDLTRQGYRTAVPLGGEVVVRYALGAIPVPEGWREVADVAIGDDGLTITDVGGGRETVGFHAGFLEN